jgi:hypothetical protein
VCQLDAKALHVTLAGVGDAVLATHCGWAKAGTKKDGGRSGLMGEEGECQ